MSADRRRLDALSVSPDASLRAAMEAIDNGAAEIALVVDRESHLLGTLTDGDVRRALLGGAGLDAPVEPFMSHNFTSVPAAASRASVLDLMRARSLSQIPILDAEGTLQGLHLLREILGASPRPNWAVVMAGGRGERLRPLTDNMPKPMVPVAGRPLLERIVLHLVGFGVRRIFLSVNYLREQIEAHFEDGANLGCTIDYLREEDPLGTGGALSLLRERPSESLIVLNGDLLTQFDVGRLLEHHEQGGFGITVGVHEYVHEIPFGVVETSGERIAALREKPIATWLANAGVYAVRPDLLNWVPAGRHYPMTSLVEECLERGEAAGYYHLEDWLDVGHHDELARAKGAVR